MTSNKFTDQNSIDPANEEPENETLESLSKRYWALQEESRIQDKVLEVSSQILRKTGSATYLEDSLIMIVTICQEALGGDVSVIELFDEENNELVGVAEYGKPYNPEGYFRLPLDESALSTLSFLENKTIAIDDVKNDRRVSQRVRQHFAAKSGIASALTVDGKAIGVLLTMTNDHIHHFTQRDIKLMDGLATQAALAVHSQLQQNERDKFEARFQRLVEFAPMAIVILKQDGTILQANKASEDLTKTSASKLLTTDFKRLFKKENEIQSYMDDLNIDNSAIFEACLKRPDGVPLHVGVSANLVSVEGTMVIQAFLRNITKRKIAERALSSEKEYAQDLAKRMSYVARHDSLTGLINRNEFERKLQEFIESADATNTEHVVCYVDLDRFKLVNDTGGHAAGDEMLKQLTKIVSDEIRKSDVFGRLGGDEFGLLLEDCSMNKAEELCQKLCKHISDFRLRWEGKAFQVSASIGLAPITQASHEIKTVLKAVDSACFLAKERGRNRVCQYQPENQSTKKYSVDAVWANRIKNALEGDHFKLEQQSIRGVGLTSKPVDWCELLLRMELDGSTHGPSDFLPSAERYHLMPEIDHWVVRTALEYIAKTSDRDARFNINISGQSLNDMALINLIKEHLNSSQLNPGQLCFEITETTASANFSEAIEFCNRLRKLGCLLALDDFGSGMSSFVYLKELPINYLKIDGYFIKNLTSSKVDYEMVTAINRIAHSMGIETVAEKIENAETLSAIREIGVDYAQGYYLHRPDYLKS